MLKQRLLHAVRNLLHREISKPDQRRNLPPKEINKPDQPPRSLPH
jgi:hypothetical protein